MHRCYVCVLALLLSSISYSQIQFTLVNSVFVSALEGNIAYADVDNDGDLDVFISGMNYAYSESTRYYRNDGTGNFTEENNTPFLNLYGDIKLIDIDNDSDIDLFISPYWLSDNSYIFLNDGYGLFNELTNHNINNAGVSDFADIDGDNDLDLFVAGNDINEFYINDGNGIFTVKNFPFPHVIGYGAAVAFTDIDGDDDEDIMISGERIINIWDDRTRLFVNDGYGNYTLHNILNEQIHGSINFEDLDGDNDQDAFLTGGGPSYFWMNLGNGDFENCPASIISVYGGDADFGDVDDDGDLDLLLCGESSYGSMTKLFKHTSIGWLEVQQTPFHPVGVNGDVVLLDYDNDNDLDAIVVGSNVADLYENGLYNLDIDSESIQDTFSIFPVPTSSLLRVKARVPVLKIDLFNTLGQYVIGNLNKDTIDISILEQGVYFVKIYDKEGKTEIKKIQKE